MSTCIDPRYSNSRPNAPTVDVLWDALDAGLAGMVLNTESQLEWNSSFDKEIQAMEQLKARLSGRLLSSKRARNAAAPIHRLPTELFIEILRNCILQRREAQSQTRCTLAMVCHSWRNTLENTPTLWSVIRSEDSRSDIVRAFVKSGETELDIVGHWEKSHWTSGYANNITDDQRSFLSMVATQSRRWRTVDLQLYASTPRFMEGATAPMLKSLSLRMPKTRWMGSDAVNLFHGRPTPRMVSLHLDGVPIQWKTLSSPNLRTLVIRNVRNLGPSLSQFLNTLSKQRKLRSLHLSSIPSLDIDDDADIGGLVELPQLSLLSIDSLSIFAVNRLLENLVLPAECQVHLQLRVRENPHETLFESHLLHLFQRCVAGVTTLVVTISSVGNTPSTVRFRSDGNWRLDLMLDNSRAVQEMIEWFQNPDAVSSEEQATSDIPVRIELVGDQPPVAMCLRPLAGLKSVRRLALRKSFKMACSSGVFECLATPIPAGHSESVLPFPGLQDIHAEEPTKGLVEDIIAMLRARRASLDQSEVSDPLQKIILGKETASSGGDSQSLSSLGSALLSELLSVVNASDIQLLWWGSTLSTRGSKGRRKP